MARLPYTWRLRACGVGPGDEVITVSHTFIATTEAILLSGAIPVFVDIDPDTYTMDVNQIEQRITPRTRAILPVHLYGQCADMNPILDIAHKYRLKVIEDACQAHGSRYHEKQAGNLGTVGCFSFYFSKNLGAYGEAGMVTTSDPEIARQIRMMRDHGSEKRYHHEMLGWNARLDELQAAVLRIKLSRLEAWNEQRRKIAQFYNQALGKGNLVIPVEAPGRKHIYHLYVIRSKNRDSLRNVLNETGIGVGIHYPIPVHLQPAFAGFSQNTGRLPVTEAIVGEILSLPIYPELTFEQASQVAEAVLSFSK